MSVGNYSCVRDTQDRQTDRQTNRKTDRQTGQTVRERKILVLEIVRVTDKTDSGRKKKLVLEIESERERERQTEEERKSFGWDS